MVEGLDQDSLPAKPGPIAGLPVLAQALLHKPLGSRCQQARPRVALGRCLGIVKGIFTVWEGQDLE